MAVTPVSTGAAAFGTGATVALPFPATVGNGELAIATLESGNGTTPAAPAGWTAVDSVGVGADGTDIGATKLMIYRRQCDGTEGGTTASFTRIFGHTIGRIRTYSGHDTTTPITVSVAQVQTPAATTVSTAGLASKVDDRNDVFLACYAYDFDSASSSGTGSSNFTGLSSETLSVAANNTSGAGGGGVYSFQGVPTSDSTGTVSHSALCNSTIWVSLLLRINASGSMGGGGGGGPYTLAIEEGAYTLGGSAVALRAARALPIAAGSFALSGTAVTLTYTPQIAPYHYSVSFEPGEYLLESHGVAMSVVARTAFLRENAPPIAATELP